jgi:hypothetical protein
MNKYTAGLTESTKKKLKEVVSTIRERLLIDLYKSLDQKFSFIARDRSKLKLDSKIRYQYDVLKNWCDEPNRIEKGLEANIWEVIKEAAYTLTNRLLIVKQLEIRGIQQIKVITGGKESEGYKQFRDLCPQVCYGSDEGFRFLLKQVFDLISLELPAFFTDTEILKIIEIPGPTLLWVIEQLNQKDLEGAWTDDTTLGWVYQFWNDPDRQKVNDKISGRGVSKGKVLKNDIAHATQLFTERYMVEWLLQNSIGVKWLAICKKNNWDTTIIEVINRLKEKKKEWQLKKKNGEISEDIEMPLDSTQEEFWKFFAKEKISNDLVEDSIDSISDLKLLDPACGSGHFLVYAFDLLFELYKEENKFIDKPLSDQAIVESILFNNLHGIDIDSRAVQITAAALYIKAKSHAIKIHTDKLNVVSSDVGFPTSNKNINDVNLFWNYLVTKAEFSESNWEKFLKILQNAEFLGSLLNINEIGRLFNIIPSSANDSVDSAIETKNAKIVTFLCKSIHQFLLQTEEDELPISALLKDQLIKLTILLRLLNQKYDVVCANPPYLGITKLEKDLAVKIQQNYPDYKDDLYSIFIIRCYELTKEAGLFSMVTMRGWMFIQQFKKLRKTILDQMSILVLADLDKGAFGDMKDVSACMFIVSGLILKDNQISVIKPVKTKEIARDRYQTGKNTRGLICPYQSWEFEQSKFKEIEGAPMIYWWPEEFRENYLVSNKIKDIGDSKQGLATGNNNRFTRKWWEPNVSKISIIESESDTKIDLDSKWYPYIKGAGGKKWFEPLSDILEYSNNGVALKHCITARYGRGATQYFNQGISFSYIGSNGFFSRLRKYKSIFDVSGSSIFTANPKKIQVILSSPISGYVIQSINPTINNQVGDIDYIPIFDRVNNWENYYNEVKKIYNSYFSSLENSIEFVYKDVDQEDFELNSLRIQNEINKEVLSVYSEDTRKTILQESGELSNNFPKLKNENRELISNTFSDIYINGPYKYEMGQKRLKKNGELERERIQTLEELSHEFQLHPESIVELRKHLGLKRKNDRQDEAYRHLAWALGVVFGRFDAQTGGLIDLAVERRQKLNIEIDAQAPKAVKDGVVLISARGLENDNDLNDHNDDRQNHLFLKKLKDALIYKHSSEKADKIWQEIQEALVYDCKSDLAPTQKSKLNLNQFLREKCFDFHKSVYENRPIYFPLSSAKKSYVIWLNIHQFNAATLKNILADFLTPEQRFLELRLDELRKRKVTVSDPKEQNRLEKEISKYNNWKEELDAFILTMSQIAEKGVNPKIQEVEASFQMDLDDGVMVNSAALWPLLYPQWKDPKKWWSHLEKPVGKNDYDWSHLAMRYWPFRCLKKLKTDPSLAVAHSDYGQYKGQDLFKEHHPDMAKKWDEDQKKKNKEHEKLENDEAETLNN